MLTQENSKPPIASAQTNHKPANQPVDEGIDLRETVLKLLNNRARIFGLGCLGVFLGAVLYLVACPFLPVQSSARINFSFPGYERAEYPDHSKFQADDLRTPEIIGEALKRLNIPSDQDVQSKIRAGITIEGLIPTDVVRERDRLRAAGQSVTPYVPDEYSITLSLPRKFPLEVHQRGALLAEILNVYRENFRRNFLELPPSFGNGFELLKDADYFEYELVLREDIRNMLSHLEQQMERAKTFRSRTTNLSFSDLHNQLELFAQIRLNESLGLIQTNGLSRNRNTAIVKMNYYLITLQDRERRAVEEDRVVNELLQKAQERDQNYILGIKNEATQSRSAGRILDQNLIDSLVSNDGYNFLLHKALDSGLKVKGVKSEIAQLMERRKVMESFQKENPYDQAEVIASVERSLSGVKDAYTRLVGAIRATHTDFTNQLFADSVRLASQVRTERIYRALLESAGIGGALGVLLGIAIALLDMQSIFSIRKGLGDDV